MNTLCEETSRERALKAARSELLALNATERVAWALEKLPGAHVLSSSFGAQAAVSLHLVAQQKNSVPVIFIDTGYHFPETYRFVDELVERLDLDLRVFRPEQSPAWQEATAGRRWEQGLEGIEHYNRQNKVEPMQAALDELKVGTWIAGLRRKQSSSRAAIDVLQMSGSRFKLHPIFDWSDRDVFNYLKEHELPYHPLWYQGYISIGDKHTTRSLTEVDDPADTRFFGLTRECGLHEMDYGGSGEQI